MSSSEQEKSHPTQCFLKVSIGGEILKEIVVELDTKNYPKTCESFLSLCCNQLRTSKKTPQPTYRGCEFHRVVPGLCVQAGDWELFDGKGGFSPLFGRNWEDEAAKSGKKFEAKHNREGIVSMANTGKPNTNGSQFFVTLKPTPHLDKKHTPFGRVVAGMESVHKMADVERGAKDRPVSLQRIVIEDCGRISNTESKSLNDDKRKKKRKKLEKKRHRRRRDEGSSSSCSSSSCDSYSSDGSDRDDHYRKRKGERRRERYSRKHRKRKHRRNDYDSKNLSDESSYKSSPADQSRSKSKKHKRRRCSRDESSKRDRKQRSCETKRRKEEKRK